MSICYHDSVKVYKNTESRWIIRWKFKITNFVNIFKFRFFTPNRVCTISTIMIPIPPALATFAARNALRIVLIIVAICAYFAWSYHVEQVGYAKAEAKYAKRDAETQIKRPKMRRSQVVSGLLRFARNDGGKIPHKERAASQRPFLFHISTKPILPSGPFFQTYMT